MTERTEQEFKYILDTFMGTDGGVRFAKLKALVEDMDRRAEERTPDGFAARKVLDETLSKMAKLIQIADRGDM